MVFDLKGTKIPPQDWWTDEDYKHYGYSESEMNYRKETFAYYKKLDEDSKREKEIRMKKFDEDNERYAAKRKKINDDFDELKKTEKFVNGSKKEREKMREYLIKNKYVQLGPSDNFKKGNIYWLIEEITYKDPVPSSEDAGGFLNLKRMSCLNDSVNPDNKKKCAMDNTKKNGDFYSVDLNNLNGTEVWEKRDTFSRFSGSKSASDFYKPQAAGKTRGRRRAGKSRKSRKGKSFKPTKRQRKTRRM